MIDFALPTNDEGKINKDSQNAAFGVLTQLVQFHTERKKGGKGSVDKKNSDDEDEETTL